MKHLLTRLYRWITRNPLGLTKEEREYQKKYALTDLQMCWLVKARKKEWSNRFLLEQEYLKAFGQHRIGSTLGYMYPPDFHEDKDTP